MLHEAPAHAPLVSALRSGAELEADSDDVGGASQDEEDSSDQNTPANYGDDKATEGCGRQQNSKRRQSPACCSTAVDYRCCQQGKTHKRVTCCTHAFVCRVQWKHKKENRKSKKKDTKKDMYALLGLEDLRWMATDSQVKKAYQKMALKHHPDKTCAGVTEEREKQRLETKFKEILVCCLRASLHGHSSAATAGQCDVAAVCSSGRPLRRLGRLCRTALDACAELLSCTRLRMSLAERRHIATFCRKRLRHFRTLSNGVSMTQLTSLMTRFQTAASQKTSLSSLAQRSGGNRAGQRRTLCLTWVTATHRTKMLRSSMTSGTCSSHGVSFHTKMKKTLRCAERSAVMSSNTILLQTDALLAVHLQFLHSVQFKPWTALLAVQCAECREHKRWIERENARLRARAKKDETRRLRDFVDRAYAQDPRIAAQKAAVRAERERKKEEKAEAARAKAEAERAEAEAARAAAAEQEAAAREAAEVARKAKCASPLYTAIDGPSHATPPLNLHANMVRALPRKAV